jgi:phage gpG-like protein
MADVKVTGIKRLLKTTNKYQKVLKSNMRGTHLAAATLYRTWIAKNFSEKGALHENGSLKWKKTKPSTNRNKIKHGRNPANILVFTGNLRNDWDISATSKYGQVRSGHGYSSFHEFGVPKRNLPKRKIFPTEKQGGKIVRPAYEQLVQKALR